MESNRLELLLVENLQSLTTVIVDALLRQAHIHAMVGINLAMLLIAGFISCCIVANKAKEKLKSGDLTSMDEADESMKRTLLPFAAGVIFFLLILTCYEDIYTPLVNPEFWAIKQIIK